jgi:cbb3-type cytochrome oxidase subunit 1
MKGIAFRFLLTGVIAVTIGMAWGLQMAISHDHTMAPAHAHLNLVGFVLFSLFGLYYHLTPQAAVGPAAIHYWVALAGLVIMVPGIAFAQTGGVEAGAAIGSILTFASMLIFLVTVFRNGLGSQPA